MKGEAWIEQGDCLPGLRSLPSESVDLVLTDPPYEVSQCTVRG